jgi:hypothetical protein
MNTSEVMVDLRKKNGLTQEKMATSMSVRPCGFLMSNDSRGCTAEFAPKFASTRTAFHVILKNMNYNLVGDLRTDLRSASTQAGTQDERLTSLLEFCATCGRAMKCRKGI